MILGIDHIDIRVKELDAALNFYCAGLGLELKRRDGNNAILIAPDGIILEVSPGYTNNSDTSRILCAGYLTGDREEAFRRSLEYGAVPTGANRVRSPTGEELEFISCPWAKGSERGYVQGLFRVTITAPDVTACTEFYRGLGARDGVLENDQLILSLPDGRELIFRQGVPAPEVPNAYSHVSLLTDNVDESLEKAARLGGRIAHEAYDWSNLRIGFAVGCGGEVIEFFSFYHDGREPDVFETPPRPIQTFCSEKE